MRLTELTLERYGAFADRSLSIPASSGLTIIYGPNEAGKSTCLSAISDFLFGIPERTPHAALFGYDGMRLGATVLDSNGVATALRRRRGRGRTLTDSAGTPLEDAVLSRLLGATSRGRFTTLFGLNHETLRSGGATLLSADGDIGRLIVEAGGGLRSLMARLDAVDEEASKLFATRRSGDRAFYQALDAFNDADREVKLHTVTRDAYEQARKAAGHAETRLSDLRAQRQKLGAEISCLERLGRAFPHLLELDRLEGSLGAYEDIAQRPLDFHKTIQAALETREAAREALASARAKRDRLLARYESLSVEASFLGAEAGVLDLGEQLILVRKARSDRPNRVRDLDAAETQLATLRRMLHVAPDADLETRLPNQTALDRVQQLANAAIERGASLVAAKARAAELQDQIATLQRRIDAATAARFAEPGGYSAAQFAGLASQASAADLARREAQAAAEALSGALGRLSFASPTELETFACPGVEEIRAEQTWHADLEAALAGQVERKVEAEGRIGTAQNMIAQLEGAGRVASDAALADARSARLEAWVPLRAAYLANNLPGDAATRRESVDTFEDALGTADDLADRRASEAERAANLAVARKQLMDSTTEWQGCETLITDLERRRDARKNAWAVAFPEAAARHPELIALLRFADRYEALRKEIEEAQLKARDADRLESELAPLRLLFAQALEVAGIETSDDRPLAAQVQALSVVLSRHEAEHADYRRDLRDLEAGRPAADRAQRDLDDLQAEQARWQEEWPAALSALGLDADLAADRAGTLIAEWSSARATLGTIAQTRTRLSRMDEDEASLRAAAAAIGTALSLALPEDPVAAADLIVSRWKEQDGLRQQRLALAPELEEARTEYASLEQTDTKAGEAVARLLEQANVTGEEDALTDLAARCGARAELLQLRLQTEKSLADVDDGLGVEMLREQLGGRDLDALNGALAAAKEQLVQLDGEIEEAILARRSALDGLAAFAEESRVNAAIAARESAAARMQAAAQRYVELAVARGMISEAIDRIRSEQQDPLIRRASELFSYTTRGAFAGIHCDLDDRGQPVVVGRRGSGADVPVAAMSDGTRDQMFLAFRLASLENYAASAEPLPFIADDILVHFDDGRSKATLDLLARFGESNQVLLFTHHESVRDQARRLEEAGVAAVVEIGSD